MARMALNVLHHHRSESTSQQPVRNRAYVDMGGKSTIPKSHINGSAGCFRRPAVYEMTEARAALLK